MKTKFIINPYKKNCIVDNLDLLKQSIICECYGDRTISYANAAFIVTACNNYDALVEALEIVKNEIENYKSEVSRKYISETVTELLNQLKESK